MGSGSASTVIVPQTPQQINESLPPLEPLPPTPIIPPKVATPKAARSTPELPKSNPVEANHVPVNPKPAGKKTPFSPTVSTTPKLIEGDGRRVIITPSEKNQQISGVDEAASKEEDMSINWLELLSFYCSMAVFLVIMWMVYDLVRDVKNYWRGKKNKITPTKKRQRKTKTRSRTNKTKGKK